jgi:hypothetical protein
LNGVKRLDHWVDNLWKQDLCILVREKRNPKFNDWTMERKSWCLVKKESCGRLDNWVG